MSELLHWSVKSCEWGEKQITNRTSNNSPAECCLAEQIMAPGTVSARSAWAAHRRPAPDSMPRFSFSIRDEIAWCGCLYPFSALWQPHKQWKMWNSLLTFNLFHSMSSFLSEKWEKSWIVDTKSDKLPLVAMLVEIGNQQLEEAMLIMWDSHLEAYNLITDCLSYSHFCSTLNSLWCLDPWSRYSTFHRLKAATSPEQTKHLELSERSRAQHAAHRLHVGQREHRPQLGGGVSAQLSCHGAGTERCVRLPWTTWHDAGHKEREAGLQGESEERR